MDKSRETLGDWRYEAKTSSVCYMGNAQLSLSEAQASLMSMLIQQVSLGRSDYNAVLGLYKDLEKIIPPVLLEKSWQIFDVEGLASSAPRQIPWSYDESTRTLYFDGTAVNNIHSNTVSPNQFAFMKAVIDAYPLPVKRKSLIKQAYGPSQKGNDVARRLYSGITLFNKTFQKHFADAGMPVYYVEPMEGFVLDVPRSKIPAEFLAEMGAETLGPIMILRKSARIWVGDQAMKRVGVLDWDVISSLFEFKGQYVRPSELAEHIYGEANDKTIDLIHVAIRKLRKKINDIEEGVGDQMIQNSRKYGYIFVEPKGQERQAEIALKR